MHIDSDEQPDFPDVADQDNEDEEIPELVDERPVGESAFFPSINDIIKADESGKGLTFIGNEFDENGLAFESIVIHNPPQVPDSDFPKWEWLYPRLCHSETIATLEELDEVDAVLDEFTQWWWTQRKCFIPGRVMFQEDRACLAKRRKWLWCEKDENARKYYEKELHFGVTQEVNGYDLYVDQGEIPYWIFKECVERMKMPMTLEDLAAWISNKNSLCTDWNKMDEFGEPFGGFWEYPEGTHEHDNAWNLSWEHNTKLLKSLPYAPSLIKDSVIVGCQLRMECVQYSNYFCHYIMSYAKHLNMI